MSSSTMPLAHGAPALSGSQLVLLRDLLAAHRSFRCGQLNQLRRAAARRGRTSTDREINELLVHGARAALRETMQALRRMNDGSYGNCVHCAEPLPIERLEMLPQAALCMPCQRVADGG